MKQNHKLLSVVEAWRSVRVLCIGDVMLDRFIHGKVERVSPEAPIPILEITREVTMLGGAGNVLRNLAALGALGSFLAVSGEDDPGATLVRLAEAISANPQPILVEKGRRTTVKTRFLADGSHLLRTDYETIDAVSGALGEKVTRAALERMDGCSVVCLSDYGKGMLTPALLRTIIDVAAAAGKIVIVDPKGTDYGRYRGATMITPNRVELTQATRMPTGADEEVIAASRCLIQEHGFGAVLATRSEQGMTLVSAERAVHIPAMSREVFDVSGAGDTVIAVVAASLAAQASEEEAAMLANIAAGIVVGKIGTACAHPDEICQALLDQHVAWDHSKVVSLDQAVERVDRWRRLGYSIGFTNGCFDLLHPGHVSLLAQARQSCGKLVVGLNTDASVSRLKGRTRPVQSEWARAAVLASLAAVDMVVLFNDNTPIRLVEAIRPDVLVKGADYTIDQVVGADIVQRHGGKVVLVTLLDGQSTTGIVKRMRLAGGQSPEATT